MFGTLRVTLLLSSFIFVKCITGQNFISPCPQLFQYLPNEATGNSWSGEVTLKSDVDLSGIYLRLVFDSPPTEVTANFGEVVQRESVEFLLKKPNYKLSASTPEKIKITVTFADKSPQLTGFRLNAKTVCPGETPPAVTSGGFVSPCPYVFNYDPPGNWAPGTWTGVLTLGSESELSGIYSRLTFDKPPLEVTADFGDVVQRESNQFLVRKPGHILPVGTALRIKLSVKYNPGDGTPMLIGVQLNAKMICPGEPPKPVTPAPLAKGLVSPCPEIFSYQTLDKENGKWWGMILLNTRVVLTDVTITLLLDRPSLQLGGWNGYLKTPDNIEYILTKPGLVLQPGVFPIKFFIRYKTSRPIPKLTEIIVNTQNVCPDDDSTILNPIPGGVLSSFQTTTWAPAVPQISSGGGGDDDFFTGSLDHFRKHGLPLGLLRDGDECGTLGVTATPFITHGQETQPGQHPWHAAIYHNKNVDLTYICGANLINKNFVLTVAHCATRQATGTALNPRLLVVVLGKYYLERLASSGIQERNVQQILVHPNYDKSLFKNDIALLRMNSPVHVTTTVRPICLWTDPVDIRSVIGQEGTVVGWGWNENGQLADQLIKTKMPIVERLTCILSYPEFFAKFTTELNYCAGFRNGSSACNGDSGGGMSLSKVVNGKTIWFLRGLVSLGVALQNLDRCDSNHYVVFTDVSKYIDWIESNNKI